MKRVRSRQNWPKLGRYTLPVPVVLAVCLAFPGASAAVQIDNIGILRGLLESDLDSAIEQLADWNRTLIEELQQTDPDAAVELEAGLEAPRTLPSSQTLALAESNFGRGLVTSLFNEDLTVEQLNLLFCRERIGAIQVLFDDSETFGDTAQLLSRVHGMGPAVPFGSHRPAFRYPLPGVTYDESDGWNLSVGALPVTVWNLGTLEALYQPVAGQRVIAGQFWLTSRELASACAAD